MARRPHRSRSNPTQRQLPFGTPGAVPPKAPEESAPPQDLPSLVQALSAAWQADDWQQLHRLMDVLKDREDLRSVRYVRDRQPHIGYFFLAMCYWQELAEYWREQTEQLDQAIDTVLDRLGALMVYQSGEGEQQEYMTWRREKGYPEVAPWETDPGWFDNPDIHDFVCETLESTPRYRAKIQRYLADDAT